ncbi:hypothetical protein CVT26_002250 [Gymnopilus dilepis]|uniref:MYND-type domain-containing protein n=1 Tax=Gymnopilus dilepis TaxID=231916 RepID=A0A409YN29_9AGAR|nr:hypothetical protein CVT26_002250 [Gymnopilus dilepis]
MSMPATQSCLVCDTPTKKSCASCKTAFYCSGEHQKQDWRAHKEYCLTIKAAGSQTFDALLFGENDTKPRIVKVPFSLRPEGISESASESASESDSSLRGWHKLDTSPWFKHPNKAVRPVFIPRLGINGPRLKHVLCLYYDDNFTMNRLPLNRCVVGATKGRAGHRWCGNVLALRMGRTYDFCASVDVEEDWEALVRYFEEYGRVTLERLD